MVRRIRAAAGVAGVLAASMAFAAPTASAPDEWIIEPSPALPTAAQDGAEAEARAQALAKQKQYDAAVEQFAQLARRFPSSTHDCYLALASLRQGDLTRAQLFDDVARLRGGERPAWCVDDLGRQLAAKLKEAAFAPLTVQVTPADAVVHVAGLSLRHVDAVWLRPGTYEVSATAPPLVRAVAQAAVTPPGANVVLQLGPPPPVAPRPVSLVPQQVPATPPVALQVARAPERKPVLWPAWAGFGVGGAALATGVVFNVLAASSRSTANQAYVGTSAFDSANSSFGRQRTVAIGGYALGALATGFATWWYASHHAPPESEAR